MECTKGTKCKQKSLLHLRHKISSPLASSLHSITMCNGSSYADLQIAFNGLVVL